MTLLKKFSTMIKHNKGLFVGIIAMIFIFLAFLGYYIGTKDSSVNNFLNELQLALQESDSDKLSKIVIDNDKKISSADLMPLCTYYGNDSLKINETISKLNYSGESKEFKLVKKKILCFSKYYLQIKKYNITVFGNFENAQYILESDGNNTKYSYDSNYGGFKSVYPGQYKLKGELESTYGDNILSNKDILVMSDISENMIFDAVIINIESDSKDASIYINDEDTGYKVSDNQKFGPILADETLSVYIKQDSPFGTLKSDEQKIGSVPTITLNPKVEGKEVEESIETSIKSFYSSVFEALNNQEIDSITDCEESVKQKIFQILNKKYFILKNQYDIISMEVNNDKSYLVYDGNNYAGVIVVTSRYSVSKKFFEINKQEFTKEFISKIIYKDDKWIVQELDDFELLD